LAGVGAGLEDDALDETAQRICRLMAVFGMVERIGNARNLAAVHIGNIGMDIRQIDRWACHALRDFVLLGLQFPQAVG